MARWLGILMLSTRFPRPPGDVGHPASWRMPVRYRTVAGASPRRVVTRDPDRALLGPFVDAARALQAEGATAVTTGCGFLVAFQRELQDALDVPVWTSSLLALPALNRPGVISVDATQLALPGVPVEGLAPGCTLQRTLLDDLPTLDARQAEADAVAAAQRLVARHPELATIVLECTNLPPYAAAIGRATGRPVHHLMTLVHERWDALP